MIGEDGGREAVFRAVRHLYRFLVGDYGQDGDEWAKDLFAGNAHGWAYIGEYSRFVEGSLAIIAIVKWRSAGQQFCPFLLPNLGILVNSFGPSFVAQRPHIDLRIKSITN